MYGPHYYIEFLLGLLFYIYLFSLSFCLLNCLFSLVKSEKYQNNGTFHRIFTIFIPAFFVVPRGNRHKIFAGGYFKGKIGFLCSP